jgi:hypothetical protein
VADVIAALACNRGARDDCDDAQTHSPTRLCPRRALWSTSSPDQNVVYDLGVIETLKGSEEPYRIRLAGVSIKHSLPIDPDLLDVSYRHSKGLAVAKAMDFGLGNTHILGVTAKPGYCEYPPHFESA